MIKAIIFDFDGVLAESVDIKTEAFRELFQDYPNHVDEIVEFHIRNGGMSRYEKFRYFYREFLKEPLSDEKFQELCDRFHKLVVDKVVAAPPVAGAEEFLVKNYKTYKMFIASGTPVEEIREIVQRKNWAGYFLGIGGSPKKKKEIIEEILKEHSLLPNETVFLGDSMNDLEGARETGVYFIARLIGKDFSWLEDPFVRGKLTDLRGLRDVLDHLHQG